MRQRVSHRLTLNYKCWIRALSLLITRANKVKPENQTIILENAVDNEIKEAPLKFSRADSELVNDHNRALNIRENSSGFTKSPFANNNHHGLSYDNSEYCSYVTASSNNKIKSREVHSEDARSRNQSNKKSNSEKPNFYINRRESYQSIQNGQFGSFQGSSLPQPQFMDSGKQTVSKSKIIPIIFDANNSSIGPNQSKFKCNQIYSFHNNRQNQQEKANKFKI